MPKVTGPLFSLEAVGKLGNAITYQRRPGGPAVVVQPDPKQPRTAGQVAQRNLMANVAEMWRGLSQGERDGYNDRANGRGMSGYNLFAKEFLTGDPAPFQVGQGIVGRDYVGG